MLTGKIFHNVSLQALEEAKLDLSTGFLGVQEMSTYWPRIVAYIGGNGPLPEFQHAVRRVLISLFVSRFHIG